MATDYFLKIEGIDGESQDEKHAGEIDVLSWSWSETQPVSTRGGGRAQSKADVSEFAFVKDLDKASPNLMKFCAGGNHVKEAVLTCRKAGGEAQEYLTITLTDCVIASYNISSGEFPIENCTIRFASIKFSYSPQKEDGTLDAAIEATYDAVKSIVS